MRHHTSHIGGYAFYRFAAPDPRERSIKAGGAVDRQPVLTRLEGTRITKIGDPRCS
jgi:hypothetical protein